MQELFHKLGEHIGYVIIATITVIIIWIKDLIKKFIERKKRQKDHSISHKNIKIHSELDEILTEFRLLTDSARISIIQFHNGEYFYNGSPILKFSMTHESRTRGMSSIIEKIQGYYLSPYYNIVEFAENDFEIHDIKDLKESNLKGFLHSNNTLCFAVLAIKCHKNINIIGLVLIEWASAIKQQSINKVEIQKTSEKYISLIKNILNNKKITENNL